MAHPPTASPWITTGSPADPFPGALGQRGTRPLFGGDVENDARVGARLDAGYWLADDDSLGVEAGFLFLARRSVNFSDFSIGSPILALPFRDANANAERASLLAFPGFQAGAVNVALSSRLWGAELDARSEVLHGDSYRVDLIGGFRHLELIETLDLADGTLFIRPEPVFGGLAVGSESRFGAGNFFYGGQIGADGVYESGPLSLRVVGKLALGDMHQIVDVSGSTTTTTLAGGSTTIRSGFLALPSNSGRFSRDEFAVVPEVGVTLGYAVTKNIRTTFGYTFLYASSVLRPGDQVDHTLNVTQIPPPIGAGALIGPQRPLFPSHDTDFWAQGVNFGLEFRY